MKKLFSLMLTLVVAAMLPFGVNAATGSAQIVTDASGNIPCDAPASDGSKVCHVRVKFTGEGMTEVNMKLTLEGGSTIKDNQVNVPENVSWSVNDENKNNIIVSSLTGSFSGESELLYFTLIPGTDPENCAAKISLLNGSTPTKDTDTDTTTENKQTGVTLPYIFLGGALLVAGYLLISTKNKSKMYKI